MSSSTQRTYGFNRDPRAEPSQLKVSFTTQNTVEQRDHHHFFVEQVRRELVNRLMETVSQDCIEIVEGLYTTEYRLNLWVLTPDQLGRLVQDKAEQLFRGSPFFYEDQNPF